MNVERNFDLAMIANAEKGMEEARSNEELATNLLVDSSSTAEEKAGWEKVAADELASYEAKKGKLAQMRAEAMGEAGEMAA